MQTNPQTRTDRLLSAPTQPPHSAARLLWFLVLPLTLMVAGVFVFMSRQRQQHALQDQTQTALPIAVSVTRAKPGDATNELVLPATLQGLDEALLYARVNGYVRGWYADIGKHVQKNQVLADIDSPEVDQQLIHTQATLSQAKANLVLAQTTAKRYRELIQDNSVAQQEVDQTTQNLSSQQASVVATLADVAQLQQQQTYEKVVAPFEGVITERRVNIGDLVNAGNNGTSELFRITRTSIMRIFVSVPEAYSEQITHGSVVQLTLTELPGQSFTGQVTRTDNAIDQNTRTLLVEVDVPNPTGKLLPGAFGQVHFKLASSTHPLLVPTSDILFQAAGPQVGIVDGSNHVHLRKVTIGRDFGTNIEITSGLSAQDTLISNPPDFLIDGMPVSTQGANPKAGVQ